MSIMGLFGGCNGSGGDQWIWIIIIVVLVLLCCDGNIFGGNNNNNCCCEPCCDPCERSRDDCC
ncbi:MAG: hypothetical protein LIO53_01045 [Oscillospiraceae bacterium]|nr:hypothetical protein [Oscillospiraceae bacterium]